ncbi:MAG: hypothetical protein Q4C70_12440 [Planctomycetia bacterium]|nr:hypothetical protein [Planctomycetia bacterium]
MQKIFVLVPILFFVCFGYYFTLNLYAEERESAIKTEMEHISEYVSESASHWLGPCDAEISPDGKFLYTACTDTAEIIKTETYFDSVSARFSLPASPTGVVLSRNGRFLWVTCDPAQQSLLPSHPTPTIPNPVLLCLETESGRVLWSVECGEGPQSPTLSPDETQIYLCARFSNRVEVFQMTDTQTTGTHTEPAPAELIHKIPMIREPYACALTPNGKTLVVSNLLINERTADEFYITGKVALIDTETCATEWVDFPNGTINMRGVCISPDGNYAYILHSMGSYAIPTGQVKGGWINMNSISFIDLRTRERTGTLTLDHYTFAAANPWDVACSADGKWLVVTHAGTMDVSVIDRLAMHIHFENSLAPYPAIGATPDHAEDLIPTQKRVFTSGRGPRAVVIGYEYGGTDDKNTENDVSRPIAYVVNTFSDTVDRIVLADNPFNSGRTILLSGKLPRPTIQRRGESLFNDGQLCFEQWQSCATCHPDARSDGLNWDLLNDGSGNPKSSKSMLYAHRTPPAMAVGVRKDAELAVRKGVESIHFMEPREKDACAMDAYLTALEPRRAPILREAETDAELHASIQRGRRLFHGNRTQCALCHTGKYYTDGRLHGVGTATVHESRPMDTPTLCECWRTAPYLHDGRYVTIFELLKEGKHGFTVPLSDKELRDLEAYVLSL